MGKKKEIHVIYIVTKLELGGAQKVCLSLFNELQKQHQSWLISGTEGQLVQETQSKTNVILLDALKREIGFSELKAFLDLIRTIKKYKTKYKNLIVHTHSTKAGYLGRWAAWFAGVKYRVHTVHGFGFHEHQSWLSYSMSYVLEVITSFITTHYVCVSTKDVEVGIDLLPSFGYKHSIIRAAVNNHLFVPATQKTTSTKSFVFGTVSCFKEQKNIFDLLHAFAYTHMHHPHSKLEIIGDGFLRPQIEKWIEQHNLQHAITLHGWQKIVAPLMRSWHVFLLSSLWEGLPCAIVEARFLKLPVIAYNVGGISDIINHGQNGLLYKPKDKEALGKGMLSLAKDKQLYQKLSSHQEDLSEFTTAAMVEEHISLYRSL
ncbi:MAG: glycosyltransferase involved in cell wall biosynthesis [Alteromonas naphthalenivorans]|jgi:glycosyltransferase involved in cell wall biosynthesis